MLSARDSKNYVRYLPNIITLMRIFLTVPFLHALQTFFLSGKGAFIVFLLFFIIVLSDLIDGYVARKWNCRTKMGSLFDVGADTLYSFSSAFLMVYWGYIPIWLPIIMIVKLFEFILTSRLIKTYKKNKRLSQKAVSEKSDVFMFDRYGRLASALFFLLPGIVCGALLVSIINARYMINIFIFGIVVLVAISGILRIKATCDAIYYNKNFASDDNRKVE